MAQPVAITASVGSRPAPNRLADQTAIAGLLNKVPNGLGGPRSPVPAPRINGVASPQLLSAILAFQTAQMEPRFRDGRIDPGGRTLVRLNALSGTEGMVASKEDQIEEETRQYIIHAFDFVTTDNETRRLWEALLVLADKRNATDENNKPINCANKPLAYAEHYLLCRMFVSCGGTSVVSRSVLANIMLAGVVGYDLVKLVNFVWANLNYLERYSDFVKELRQSIMGLILKLGKCPMSDHAPDLNSTAWGARGAKDGLSPMMRIPTF